MEPSSSSVPSPAAGDPPPPAGAEPILSSEPGAAAPGRRRAPIVHSSLAGRGGGASDLSFEEFTSRRRRRFLLRWAPIILGVLVLGWLAAKPAWRAGRAWQARRAAREAAALMEQEKWPEAFRRGNDAYLLRANEPEAVRVMARLLTRAGRAADALKFWRQLSELGSLQASDRRDFAAAALGAGEIEAAGNQLELIRREAPGGGAALDLLLMSQHAARIGDPEKAAGFALKILEPATKAAPRERFAAAQVLLSLSSPRGRAEAVRELQALARTTGPASLEALLWEARRPSGAADRLPTAELITLLSNHPGAAPIHRLIALDLELREAPARREEIIGRAIAFLGQGDAEALARLAQWLNEKGEWERVLQLVPAARSSDSGDLYLARLDALGGLGRWTEVRREVESQRFPIDPLLQEMYLARALTQLGEKLGADNRWARALKAAQGSAEKFLQLARYAERAGAAATAESALRAAVELAPDSRSVHEALLRFLSERPDTASLQRQIRAMLAVWPNDAPLQNDDAYLSALRGETLDAAAATAERLMKDNLASLPHRTTLALACQRLGRNADALGVFRGITVPEQAWTPAARTVHAAVLKANGFTTEARAEAEKVPRGRLRPEERELLDSVMR